MMVEAITVRLHDQNNNVQEVIVNPNDLIQVLDVNVPGKERRFLYYKGNILMTSFSFKFFNIHDGDDIFILRAHRRKTDDMMDREKARCTSRNAAVYNFMERSTEPSKIEGFGMSTIPNILIEKKSNRIRITGDLDDQNGQSNQQKRIVRPKTPCYEDNFPQTPNNQSFEGKNQTP